LFLFFSFCGTQYRYSGPILWATAPFLFCYGFTIWLQTVMLLISVSWVARITGVRHGCPVPMFIFLGGKLSDVGVSHPPTSMFFFQREPAFLVLFTLVRRCNGNVMEGEWTCSRYTVCIYGIITMKVPHIINLLVFKNKIKN
jgi:hypothetical protein